MSRRGVRVLAALKLFVALDLAASARAADLAAAADAVRFVARAG